MSRTQKETPSTTKKNYTYFDLDTFDRKTVEKEIPRFVPLSAGEIASLIENDPEVLNKAVNAYAKRQVLKKVKAEVASLGGSTKAVMSMAKPLRSMPPFNQIFELDENGKPVIENGEKVIDRPKQTKAIFETIKASPALVEAIKAASLQAAEADEDDDNDETED